MKDKYIVTGKLTNVRTLTLDEALPLEGNMKVRVIIEPLNSISPRPYLEVMREIRQRQRERGYTPSTKETVDAYINAERDSWSR